MIITPEKEARILELLSEGYTSIEISERMNINRRTLEDRIKKMKKRIGVYSTVELVVHAIKNELITVC